MSGAPPFLRRFLNKHFQQLALPMRRSRASFQGVIPGRHSRASFQGITSRISTGQSDARKALTVAHSVSQRLDPLSPRLDLPSLRVETLVLPVAPRASPMVPTRRH